MTDSASETILFRAITTADIFELVRLRVQFQGETYQRDPADPRLTRELTAYFSNAIPAKIFVGHVATLPSDQIVATAGMVYHQYPPSAINPTGRQAYIMNMYTLPPYRRRGIATHLLQELIERARRDQMPRISLHAQIGARPLYQSLGFVPVDSELRLEFPRN